MFKTLLFSTDLLKSPQMCVCMCGL